MRAVRRVTPLALLASLLPAAAPAGPDGPEEAEGAPRVEVHGLVDARFAAASATTSWIEGGFGRTRYGGADRDGDGLADRGDRAFHVSQLSLVVDGRLKDDLTGHVHFNFDLDGDRRELLSRVGVVEAFLAWSPVLTPSLRLKLRGGITIPPFSLEHPEVAWSTRYTITPSVIGAWLGEEVKSTGAEATLVVSLPRFNELDLQGAVFSSNDTTGALLAWRGWGIHDRQGVVDDELPLPPVLSLTDPRFFPRQGTRTSPFVEVDGRPGFHAQARLRFGARGLLQGGYYDNHGDLEEVEPGERASYTWHTRFAVAGGEVHLGPVALLGQYVEGTAEMGFVDPERVDAPFRAFYGLASARVRDLRVTFRYDDFEVEDEDVWREGKDLNVEEGWAATVAWIYHLGERHRLHAEYIYLEVDRPFAVTAGEEARIEQEQFQAGYRLTF